jgi:hypothetical protein
MLVILTISKKHSGRDSVQYSTQIDAKQSPTLFCFLYFENRTSNTPTLKAVTHNLIRKTKLSKAKQSKE